MTKAKWLWIAENLGCVLGILGALLLSTGHFTVLTTFILYFFSSLFWVIAGFIRGSKPLIFMNVCFLLININGLYTHFKP